MPASDHPQPPADPVGDLFAHLKRVYLQGGQPSFRTLAGKVGYSYTTVHSAVRGPRVPKWGVLELVGEQLGADLTELKTLWTAAREAVEHGSDNDESARQVPLRDRLDGAHRDAMRLLATVRTVRLAPQVDFAKGLVITERRNAHKGKINAVIFGADSATMATAGQDGVLRIWKPDEGNSPFLQIEAHDGSIYGASFSRSGNLIATAGSDRVVNVWDPKDGSLVAGPLEHDRSVRDIAFGLDDDLLVSVSSDGSTRIWNPTMGYVVEEPFARRSRPLLCAAVSPDHRLVAVGGADGVVELWDSTGGTPPSRFAAHTDQVKTVAFNPVDGTLASSGTDRSTLLWDTRSGHLTGEGLHGHDGTVYSLAFSPDGSLLASGSYDGTVRGTTMPSMALMDHPIVETSSAVRSVAFSPDGMVFAVASADGSILLCSSTRAEISGAELNGVLTGLEHLVEVTRLHDSP